MLHNCARVRNYAFLFANATKNFALATRISQLPVVASWQLITLHVFHATIITQKMALIFSHSKPPADWSLSFYLSVALEV